ncbi:MAG TPA: DUF4249 domain-containing protein [Hanamia sp.]
MKKIAIIAFAVFTIVFISCEKQITIKQQPYQSKLSIEGLITPGQTPQIFISRTVPYFDPKVKIRDLTVDNAAVTLNDGATTSTLQFDSVFNNQFCSYDYFYGDQQKIQANKTYTLNIIFNGGTYSAQATTNQTIVPITSIGYISNFKDLYGEHEGIVVGYTDKPGEQNYYRYEMGRMIDSSVTNGTVKSVCTFGQKYYVKEIGRTVYSDKNVDGLPVTFTFEPTYSHKLNDSAYIRLQSVDRNIFNFYDNLDRQKLAQFNPFIEPVFIAPGQFKNAIGVFGAYTLSDSVLFVYPE